MGRVSLARARHLGRGIGRLSQRVTEHHRRLRRSGLVPARPNGSSISQVRSNEIALSFPWELREFGLNTAGNLVERTVAQTPQGPLDGSTRVRDFINDNQAAIWPTPSPSP